MPVELERVTDEMDLSHRNLEMYVEDMEQLEDVWKAPEESTWSGRSKTTVFEVSTGEETVYVLERTSIDESVSSLNPNHSLTTMNVYRGAEQLAEDHPDYAEFLDEEYEHEDFRTIEVSVEDPEITGLLEDLDPRVYRGVTLDGDSREAYWVSTTEGDVYVVEDDEGTEVFREDDEFMQEHPDYAEELL